jgi:pimeloyl-ACP methyl ester carboxylesterase
MSEAITLEANGPVHVVDHGGDGPAIVCVHGLGGSALNWDIVADRLTERHHVYAVDLIGFGRTPAAGRDSTIVANRDMLLALIENHTSGTATLVGNSMGGLIAMATAAHAPQAIEALVLVDPAIPPPRFVSVNAVTLRSIALPSLPVIGPALLGYMAKRTTSEEQVRGTLGITCVDPSRVPPEYVDRAIALVEERRSEPWAARSFSRAARSMLLLLGSRRRMRSMVHAISCPVLVVHGEQDGLVPLDSARGLIDERPDWEMLVLDDVGHVPPIEAPHRLADAVLGWLPAV